MHTLTVIPAIFIVSLGMWAAERRLLEDPARHGALLRRIATACGCALSPVAPARG
jgi:hypothetical protein